MRMRSYEFTVWRWFRNRANPGTWLPALWIPYSHCNLQSMARKGFIEARPLEFDDPENVVSPNYKWQYRIKPEQLNRRCENE